MSDELKNILSNSNKDIDNQQLMDYLSNQLSKEASHEIEKNMADDDFMNDAVEGLQQIENKHQLQAYTEQLNKELKKHLDKNKNRKDKRKWKDQPYTYYAVILIILLIIISYLVIKQFLKG
ncbi:hypothetical protein ACQ33O_07580 [Ferruginibacter sp. SUN002]|uniref:hypothetical protein n=1 Tax=Ferruginibacter sp. SUN002 TaxID=2937789 RepID=UPI003D36FB04